MNQHKRLTVEACPCIGGPGICVVIGGTAIVLPEAQWRQVARDILAIPDSAPPGATPRAETENG